jgi:hypothetical protein
METLALVHSNGWFVIALESFAAPTFSGRVAQDTHGRLHGLSLFRQDLRVYLRHVQQRFADRETEPVIIVLSVREGFRRQVLREIPASFISRFTFFVTVGGQLSKNQYISNIVALITTTCLIRQD